MLKINHSGIRRPSAGAVATVFIFAATWALLDSDSAMVPLWPSAVALVGVVLSRRIFFSLILGALSGAVILQQGNPWQGLQFLAAGPAADIFTSSWKLAALTFTLMLGGMAGLIERGGGMRTILRLFTRNHIHSPRRIQWAAYTMGYVCFFDGLANSMMVGRMTRAAADEAGLSRAKLAYLVDSTSSAVACVALLSTWIAFQLSMIQEGYQIAGQTINAYALFIHSIPLNFYCLFTLALAALSIHCDLLPRAMARFEHKARRAKAVTHTAAGTEVVSARAASAWVPLLVLTGSLPVGLFLSGADFSQPLNRESIALAFGHADAATVLVLCSLLASITAFLMQTQLSVTERLRAYVAGCGALVLPLMVLMAAWLLGGSLEALGSGKILAGLLQTHIPFWALPTAVFITGSLISFTTGTSWGTMALLMPLAIPAALAMASGSTPETLAPMALIVAAVFSGAVFGDHCSPLSDTTLVSSLSCGIAPIDHVRSQMPYALLAGTLAVFTGFLPAAAGVPGWLCLSAGGVCLLACARFGPRGADQRSRTA